MEKIKEEVVKFNTSMKKSLFERIEKYSDDFGMNRSAFIAMCCSQYINSQDGLIKMQAMIDLMKQLNEKSNLSSEDLKKLKELQTFAQISEESLKG